MSNKSNIKYKKLYEKLKWNTDNKILLNEYFLLNAVYNKLYQAPKLQKKMMMSTSIVVSDPAFEKCQMDKSNFINNVLSGEWYLFIVTADDYTKLEQKHMNMLEKGKYNNSLRTFIAINKKKYGNNHIINWSKGGTFHTDIAIGGLCSKDSVNENKKLFCNNNDTFVEQNHVNGFYAQLSGDGGYDFYLGYIKNKVVAIAFAD